MEINITILLKVLLLYGLNFLIVFWMYRYILYPRYRWSQKGNVCHDDRLEFSIIATIILSVIEYSIYNKVITFTF